MSESTVMYQGDAQYRRVTYSRRSKGGYWRRRYRWDGFTWVFETRDVVEVLPEEADV